MSATHPFANLIQWVEQLHECVVTDTSPAELHYGISLIDAIKDQLDKLKGELQAYYQDQFEEDFPILKHALDSVQAVLNGTPELSHIAIELYIDYIQLQVKELLALRDKTQAV